jgi:hypothetical protein
VLDTSIQTYGLKESLKELNKVQPTLRRQLTKDVQQIAQPFIAEINRHIVDKPPLSGMAYKWHYQGRKDRARILPARWSTIDNAKIKINTRGARNRNAQQGARYETLTIFAVRWNSRILNVLEFAGKGKINRTRDGWVNVGDNFVDQLANKQALGGIYKALDHDPRVMNALEDELIKTIDDAIYHINQKVSVR